MKEGADMPTIRICPKCGKTYTGIPAKSRVDNETLICPDCETRESLESLNVVCKEEQDRILDLIHGRRN